MPSRRQLRRTVELFREEFRALSLKYPPVFHERFISPLPVGKEGWDEFVRMNRCRNDTWELWYVADKGNWLGRFYGQPDGFKEFSRLVANLCHLLSVRSLFSGPVAWWMDTIHAIAELEGMPLLNVERSVWNWEPDDHICPEFGGVEDAEPYLHMWDERYLDKLEVPRHPLQRELTINVYSASVIALEVSLDPEAFYTWWDYRKSDFPIDLSAPDEPTPPEMQTNQELAQVAWQASETTVLDVSQDTLSDFLFKKQGDTWAIRFKSGNTTEAAIIQDVKGLAHYRSLLLKPLTTITALDLDPRDTPTMAPSHITADEAAAEFDLENFSGFGSEHGSSESLLGDETIRFLATSQVDLEKQIETESDPKKKTQLVKELKQVKRSLNQRRRTLDGETEAGKAFRRVKKALYDAKHKLKSNGLVQLATHLETWVNPVGFGFRYDPNPIPNWMF